MAWPSRDHQIMYIFSEGFALRHAANTDLDHYQMVSGQASKVNLNRDHQFPVETGNFPPSYSLIVDNTFTVKTDNARQ